MNLRDVALPDANTSVIVASRDDVLEHRRGSRLSEIETGGSFFFRTICKTRCGFSAEHTPIAQSDRTAALRTPRSQVRILVGVLPGLHGVGREIRGTAGWKLRQLLSGDGGSGAVHPLPHGRQIGACL